MKELFSQISNFKFQILLAIFVVFALCSMLTTSQVKAASSFDLSVSPQIYQIELTPPSQALAKQTLTLENPGNDPLPIHLEYRFFKPEGSNGDIIYLAKNSKVGNDPNILDKIGLFDKDEKIESLTLPPKTKKQFDLIVSIPKDEPPGDYYFSIIFLADVKTDDPNIKSTQSTAIGGIATNVLLSIGPKTKTTGSIEEFSTPFFKSNGPVDFMVRIKNSSPHFIYPQGQILITNMFGQKIGKIDLLPLNILSDSSRSLPSREQFESLQRIEDAQKGQGKEDQKTLKTLEALGKLNKSDSSVAVWPETFLLGPYKATLTIALSDEGPLYVRSIHFIGLPLGAITAFVICLTIIFLIKSRLSHRERKEQS